MGQADEAYLTELIWHDDPSYRLFTFTFITYANYAYSCKLCTRKQQNKKNSNINKPVILYFIVDAFTMYFPIWSIIFWY